MEEHALCHEVADDLAAKTARKFAVPDAHDARVKEYDDPTEAASHQLHMHRPTR